MKKMNVEWGLYNRNWMRSDQSETRFKWDPTSGKKTCAYVVKRKRERE